MLSCPPRNRRTGRTMSGFCDLAVYECSRVSESEREREHVEMAGGHDEVNISVLSADFLIPVTNIVDMYPYI